MIVEDPERLGDEIHRPDRQRRGSLMTVQLASVTFDCADALVVARFWSAALDRPLDADPTTDFASIGVRPPGASPSWMFAKVPEGKTAKNRVHVDLTATDRRAEVDRLIGLGAERMQDVEEWGFSWTVMHDPEGNEFCVAESHSPSVAGAAEDEQ
jgi:hypothetical protein